MSDNYLKDLFIDEVKGALKGSGSGSGGDTSALEATMNQKFTEVNAKIDGIEIGGRNLLLGSDTAQFVSVGESTLIFGTNVGVADWRATDAIRVTGTGGTTTTFAQLNNIPSRPSLPNQKYALSIYIKNDGENAISARTPIGSGTVQISPGESKRVFLYGTGNGALYASFNLATATAGEAFNFIYWHPKIEYGNKVTDWTPAPEDIVSDVTALETTANQKFTEVNEKIDGIEVGGRNLLLGSDKQKLYGNGGGTMSAETGIAVTEWGATDAIKVTGTGGTSATFAFIANIPSTMSVANRKYTASVYVKNDGDTDVTVKFNGVPSDSVVILSGETKRVVVHGVGNGSAHLQINLSTATAGEAFDLTYWHPKIEEGNIATAWTPAPEDVDERLTSAMDTATAASNAANEADQTATEAYSRAESVGAALTEEVSTINGRINDLEDRVGAIEGSGSV